MSEQRERERSLFCLSGGAVRDPTSPFFLSLEIHALKQWQERSGLGGHLQTSQSH